MLSRYDIRDVQAAMAQIAEEPRDRYESKVPELGEVKQRVEAVQKQRTAVPFEPCGNCFNGLLIHTSGHGDTYRSWAEDCQCKRDWLMKKRAAAAPLDDRKMKAAGE